MKVCIRSATREDVGGIALLCDQLGYPSSSESVKRRLSALLREADHAVLVAEGPDGSLIGWVHVCRRQLVVADPPAEIGGLVVDEGHRRQGVGRLLMAQAERWASEHGCQAVLLRSNVLREGAQAFYDTIGCRVVKKQLTFRKRL